MTLLTARFFTAQLWLRFTKFDSEYTNANLQAPRPPSSSPAAAGAAGPKHGT